MKKKSIPWQIRVGILFSVVVALFVGGFIWWNDGVSPVDRDDKQKVRFSVARGEEVRGIAARLASERLIRSRTAFFLLVKAKGIDNRIQAGAFELSRSMNADEIAEELMHGAQDIWVTTLEGWRKEEVVTKLAIELKIPERELLAYANEGYLFPDTYLIPQTASAASIMKIINSNFQRKADPVIMSKPAPLGLSSEEVIILASLVEREGRSLEDKRVIAGILLNRLKIDMKLDIDATLQYVLGYDANAKTWWRKQLTNQDKLIDSPYNTYKYKGLPPGPIANPGLVSIQAVMEPVTSEYLFYLHDPSGKAHYAKTLAEHESNIDAYLR